MVKNMKREMKKFDEETLRYIDAKVRSVGPNPQWLYELVVEDEG